MSYGPPDLRAQSYNMGISMLAGFMLYIISFLMWFFWSPCYKKVDGIYLENVVEYYKSGTVYYLSKVSYVVDGTTYYWIGKGEPIYNISPYVANVTKVPIYYNPKNPTQCTLSSTDESVRNWGMGIAITISSIIVLFLVFTLYEYIINKKNDTPQVNSSP